MGFWSLNPYVGCEFGCAYCYARETHQWMVERAANHRDAPATAREAARLPVAQGFERRILVKHTAPEVLARTIDPARLGATPVVIGSATDPYQPAERRFEVTRRVLQVFLRHEGLHIGIITKSALIARDTELLATLARRHAVTVHFSIGSLDRQLLRQLEPRSAAPHARLRVLRRLVDHGISCDVLIMPILPGLTDGEDALRDVMLAARQAGAEAVAGGSVRMGPATRNTLLPWLDCHRPALAARYRAHFSGQQYVSKAYAQALHKRLHRLQTEVGFDVAEGSQREGQVRGAARLRPMQTELPWSL
jgi:DNA repair photolyase